MEPSIDGKHKQNNYKRIKRSNQGTVPQKSPGPDYIIRECSKRDQKR